MASKYQIRVDGNVLGDLTHPQYAYYNANLKSGVNISGSFNFSLMPNNPIIEAVKPLKSTITLLKRGKIIWCGRVIKTKKNLYNQYEVFCEGALSWLYDVLIPPTPFKNSKISSIVSSVIDSYNSLCSENRLFEIGEIDGEDEITLTNRSEYDSVFEILKEIITINGGYFIVKFKESGTPILNYYKEGIETQNQVRFGENLLDINEHIDTTKIITALYATGNDVSLPSPNYIENEDAVNSYGRIFGYIHFEDITSQIELIKQSTNYLKQNMLGDISIKVKAIAINWDANVGENVRVVSKPNGIDANMIISEVSTNLNDEAAGYITIGASRKTLTKTLALEAK